MELQELSRFIEAEHFFTEREEINHKTKEFLNRGGKIKKIKPQKRTIEQIYMTGTALDAIDWLRA